MFTSDDRDDVKDDNSVLGHKPFSSDHKQHQVHNHHQLPMLDLPSPYPFQCFSNDFDYPERAGINPDFDLILFHPQQLHLQQQPKPQYQQQQQQQDATLNFLRGEGERETRVVVSAGPGMRSSKKDRHSKITTARGPRDRRMRLSLEVAREFFDLQDMLGFDKASKTVEWLILQSESAIKEIVRKVKGSGCGGGGIAASYASDCEIGYNHSSDDNGRDRTAESSAGRKRSNKVRQPRQPRRSDSHRRQSPATRESRRRARERARERTLEKMWKKRFESSRSILRKPCSSPLETGEDSSCVQTGTTGSNLEILTECEEITAGRISGDVSSDLVCSRWSPAMAFISNLNLQEIGIPRFTQLRDCEQLLRQWDSELSRE